MSILIGVFLGFMAWFVVRHGIFGFFSVNQDQRAVKTVFGRAQRLPGGHSVTDDDPNLSDQEKERYRYPALRVLSPGGPYFKLPWERIHKVTVSTQTINMAFDPETPSANQGGTVLEAVTKDQLNTGLSGQIRYQISEKNLYGYLFAVKNPLTHVMGYFIALLRERIANFESPEDLTPDDDDGLDISKVSGISINDLRKNLSAINDHMLQESNVSEGRYGISLEASLITGIDPPADVDSALAAINTAHNEVSSDISLAQAAADQTIVQSKRAVEIQTLEAHAEVEPLLALSQQLAELRHSGVGALKAYLRNVRLGLYEKASRVFVEVSK